MRRIAVVGISTFVFAAMASSAHSQFLDVVSTIVSATQTMRKWQNDQPWGKFYAAKPGASRPDSPLMILNLTGIAVSYSIDSEHCATKAAALQPNSRSEFRCSGTGDSSYTVHYAGYSDLPVDGGTAVTFEVDYRGELYPHNVTLDGLEATLESYRSHPEWRNRLPK